MSRVQPMMHRAEGRFSTHMLCGLSYDQVGRLGHTFIDDKRDDWKTSCTNCQALAKRAIVKHAIVKRRPFPLLHVIQTHPLLTFSNFRNWFAGIQKKHLQLRQQYEKNRLVFEQNRAWLAKMKRKVA